MNLIEEKIGGTTIYNGKILSLAVDKVKLPNGSESFREIVNHNGGVSVLVVHNGKALIEKQFRYAYKEVIYEIPAGKLEKGENPEMAGIRELEEECGLKADKLKFLTCLYPTPAYTNEHLYVFFCDSFKIGRQKLDKDEFLTYDWIELETLYSMIKNGEIKDAKTVFALLAYKSGLYE